MAGLDELPGKTNYFIGNEPAKWRTNIATYGKVKYQQVYRGVDMVYYGNQQQLEYDFVISPGADPRVIKLQFAGANHLRIDAAGNLVLDVVGSRVVQQAPVIYQESDGVRQAVSGRYVLLGRRQVGFRVGAYDRSRPLVIDPSLVYSTYLGGLGSDAGFAIAVDTAGNAYVTGTAGHPPTFAVDTSQNAYVTGLTESIDFPTVNAFQPTCADCAPGTARRDAFVTKVSQTGSSFIYSTYLGGDGIDEGYGIAVDSSGSVYVTGITYSSNFPRMNPFQAVRGGSSDAFVTKLSPAGNQLVYSTYLGGDSLSGSGFPETGNAIAVDGFGNAYVTGLNDSTNFPTVDPSQPYAAGNVFVSKFNASGMALLFSTTLGNSFSTGNGIAVEASGNAYITGLTRGFPTTPGVFQPNKNGFENAFVAKLNLSTSPICAIQLNKTSFANGDQVIAQLLRITNPTAAALAIEFKCWFEVPGSAPISFTRGGADGSVVLPAGFTQNVGPLTLFTVTSAFPRGTYAFACRFVEPVTGRLQVENLNPFAIQ